MSDDDSKQFSNVIKHWATQSHPKIITDTLQRIQTIKFIQSQQNLNEILEALGTFHKQANKASKEQVEDSWFQEIIKSKKYINKLLESKKRAKLPKIIRHDSRTQYPKQLWEGKSKQYQDIMKSLYKNFLLHMDQQVTQQKQKICQFLDKVINFLFEQFGLNKKTPAFNLQEITKMQIQSSKLHARVDHISKQLSKLSSVPIKKQAIQGKTDPKAVATGEQKAFGCPQKQKIMKAKYDELIKQNQCGFYDNMKKEINKDANEECRFCKKPAAYCEGQKQIRASDEPMTRFMICNLCGSRWRQQ